MNFSNFNNSNDSVCREIEEEQLEALLYSPLEFLTTVVTPCILVFGIIGNFSFLVVVFRIKWMRTVVNCYLVNLAVADILFLLFAAGDQILAYLVTPVGRDDYFRGKTGCILIHLVKDACFFSSLALITLVTLQKFYAVCQPYQYKRCTGRRQPTKFIFVSWFLSVTFGCLLIPGTAKFETFCIIWPQNDSFKGFPEIIGFCLPHDHFEIIGKILQSVPFLMALIVNFYLYGKIIVALHRRTTSGKGSNEKARIRTRNQMARMVIANGIIFFLCLSPIHITSLVTAIRTLTQTMLLTPRQFTQMRKVFQVIAHLNSAINPIVYNATNPRYRQAFCQTFCCCCLPKNSKYRSAVQLREVSGTKTGGTVSADRSFSPNFIHRTTDTQITRNEVL
ncbi:thyrotropin-releasing hormone receptor-like [Patiria miniata]|uniref:G-protein coupled receptors family 1 profile domain-containing protein n=1 Tax=Patiria miniata TaxID=46514 RepID=A0A914A0E1_PATMI|nr:thyrotropin-releasing hormone receptor-like [Patiria miniata]